MGNGEWGMGNGEWGMGNGEWGMGNGEWGKRCHSNSQLTTRYLIANRLTASTSSSTSKGFSMKASQSSLIRRDFSVLYWPVTASTLMPASDGFDLIWRVASAPSMTGMSKSITI